jgi:hypothetical protein
LVAANRFLRGLTIILVVLALVLSGILLIQDARIEGIRAPARSVISAASLLLIGVAFLIVQPMMRLRPKEFLKNLLLATSFILWGMVQLMPQNVLSIRLGGVVIALYVLDLAWVTLLSTNSTSQPEPSRRCLANCCTCGRTARKNSARNGRALKPMVQQWLASRPTLAGAVPRLSSD